ncbi:MAG: hypothetical protein Q7S47_01895 [bacterium]|nr:hypothetical protein [bacterium]
MSDREDTKKRNLTLLTRIVHEYIVSGHPIGSLFLAEKYNLPISSATIRNAMVLLEEEGYMYQPHPSAGRVPTEQGYRVYIETMKPIKMTKASHDALEQVWLEDERHDEQHIKKLAKGLAALCGDVVFAALEGSPVMVAGLSNLCERPEFEDRIMATQLSNVIDSLDDTVDKLFDEISDEPQVLIGSDGFADVCSVIVVKFHGATREGILGILGPLRMNYARNVSLLKMTKDIIEDT